MKKIHQSSTHLPYEAPLLFLSRNSYTLSAPNSSPATSFRGSLTHRRSTVSSSGFTNQPIEIVYPDF
ncbi:hypothetical protein L2E82_11920 [Cichorium intybus]|uniref:Uncharacterized protein n=1 Tax=Cichorium intybus TaxID=13427 RepID=A0ACB9GEU3_CICIN|nr:hypothetical protein L2E82_11920 [Cichorium intybus]